MEGLLTVLVPVYNERDCIGPLALALTEFLNASSSTKILFINDGSTDGSEAAIEAICGADSRYGFISFIQNKGLSTALKAGIDHCNTPFVGYIDADLQTHPADFPKLIEFMNDYDLVMGYRKDRKDTLIKKASSTIANSFRQWLLKDDIIDTGCPLKIMRTDLAKQMPFFRGMHRFIPNMVMLLGGSVKQVPVQHFPRYAGQAKYNLMNRMTGPFIDSVAFRWMQKSKIQYTISRKAGCR
ncbi:MAG: glycosyltransferase family 2 protein [Chryseolinea sp.]